MPRVTSNLFYGWVVIMSFLFIGTVIYGLSQSFGVFFKAMGSEYGLTRAETSMIISIQNILGCMLSFVAGWTLDRLGPKLIIFLVGLLSGLSMLLTSQTNAGWQLFVTYSLFFSVLGAVYTTIIGTVSRWFNAKRGIAMGIAGAGVGLGGATLAPLSTFLISSFNWRMADIVLGFITLIVVIPLSFLLKKSPREIGAEPDGAKPSLDRTVLPIMKDNSVQSSEFSLREASRTRSFWLFTLVSLLNAFCYSMMFIHIVPHITDIGIPGMQAASIISAIGVSMIIGRLLLGKISDTIGRRKIAISCALIAAAAMITLIWSKELTMFYVCGAAFGFSMGGLDTSMAALIGDTFGMHNIGTISGATQVSWGIGMIVGPVTGGLVFDLSSDYILAFISGAIAMLIITIFVALTRRETAPSTVEKGVSV